MVGVEYRPRCPRGLLLVNTETEEVIIYDRVDEAVEEFTFAPRKGIRPVVRDERAAFNIHRARDEPKYDLLTYDESRMGPWLL